MSEIIKEFERYYKEVETAQRKPGIPSMIEPKILLSINANGKETDYFLWCDSPWGKGSLMPSNDSHVLYSLSEEGTLYLRELLMSVGYFNEDKKTHTETMVADSKIDGRYETARIVDVSKDSRYFIITKGNEKDGKMLHILWDNLSKREISTGWVMSNIRTMVPEHLKSQFIENDMDYKTIPKPKDMPDTMEIQMNWSYASYSPDRKRIMYNYGKTPIELRVYHVNSKKHTPVFTYNRAIDNERRNEMRIRSFWLEDGSIFTINRIGKWDGSNFSSHNARIIKFNDKEIGKMLDNAEIYKNLLKSYGSNMAPEGHETIVNMATTEINKVVPFDDGFLVLVSHRYKKSEVCLFYMKIGEGIISKFSGNYPKEYEVSINKANINGKNIVFGRTSDLILDANNQSTEADYSKIEVELNNGKAFVTSLNPEPGYCKNGFIIVEDEGKIVNRIKFYNWQGDMIREEKLDY